MIKKSVLLSALLVLMLMATASAQLDFGLKGIGGKLGYIMPDGNIDNAIGLGAVADLGTFKMISLAAYLDYWGKNYSETSYWDFTWSVISIAAIGKYYFPMEGSLKPYAGAGLGFDISSWKSEYKGPPTAYGFDINSEASDSSFDLALHILGGASYALSPTLDGFAEAKYTTGHVDYFGIYVGVIYKLK